MKMWQDSEKEIARLNELLELIWKELNNKKNNSAEQIEEVKFLIKANTDIVK